MNRINRKVCFIFIVSRLLVSAGAWAQTSTPEITAEELKAHVKYLASDELEGRLAGTEGNRKAAAYIADQMKLGVVFMASASPLFVTPRITVMICPIVTW